MTLERDVGGASEEVSDGPHPCATFIYLILLPLCLLTCAPTHAWGRSVGELARKMEVWQAPLWLGREGEKHPTLSLPFSYLGLACSLSPRHDFCLKWTGAPCAGFPACPALAHFKEKWHGGGSLHVSFLVRKGQRKRVGSRLLLSACLFLCMHQMGKEKWFGSGRFFLLLEGEEGAATSLISSDRRGWQCPVEWQAREGSRQTGLGAHLFSAPSKVPLYMTILHGKNSTGKLAA